MFRALLVLFRFLVGLVSFALDLASSAAWNRLKLYVAFLVRLVRGTWAPQINKHGAGISTAINNPQGTRPTTSDCLINSPGQHLRACVIADVYEQKRKANIQSRKLCKYLYIPVDLVSFVVDLVSLVVGDALFFVDLVSSAVDLGLFALRLVSFPFDHFFR